MTKNKKEGKFAFELRRELFHIFVGIAILLLALFYDKTPWLLFITLIIGAVISLLSLSFKIPFIHYMLLKFERPRYLDSFPGKGVLFFLAGCLLVLKLFSLEIALAAIAILTFGDSFSHLAGVVINKIIKDKRFEELKNIEGAIMGIIAGTIASAFFVNVLLGFIASCIAMTIEFIGLSLGEDDVDDNFIIPLVAGTIIYLLMKLI